MFNCKSVCLLALRFALIGLVVAGCGSPSVSSGNAIEWVRFEGRGVSLNMPSTFTAIDLSPETRANLIEHLKSKGGSNAQLAATLEHNPNIYRLMLADAAQPDIPTNVNIVGGKAEAANPKAFLEDLTWKLPDEAVVKSLDEMSVGKSPAARMVIEWTQSSFTQAAYAVRYIDTLFVVTYSAESDQFNEMLPIFEQSIQTFAVEP
jgi:hypothetical protein